MEKHTPTPWTRSGAEILGPVDSSVTGIPTRPVIAKITSCYWGPEVAKADARFIERAVNNFAPMLAALEAWVQLEKDSTSTEPRPVGECWRRGKDLVKVSEALIKAAKEGA